LQAAGQIPAFVQPKQDSGAKRVARSRCASDKFLRKLQRRLPHILALASASKTAFREVDDHDLPDPTLKQSTRGVA
jgi:hypothetical protein